MTFQDAKMLFERRRNGSNTKHLENNTHLYFDNQKNCFCVVLHASTIVEIYEDGHYQLYSGGYHSNTTKKRLNKYTPAGVFQKDWEWYVIGKNKNHIFHEGIVVDQNGYPPEEVKKYSLFED